MRSVADRGLSGLRGALDLQVSELLRVDFAFGVVGACAGVVLAIVAPARLIASVGILTGLVGVIIGAVIASVSIQVALFDQTFLRKLRAIGREPTRYMAPFLFTVVLGVVAMIGLIVLGSMTVTTPTAVLALVGGATGLFSVWTIVSPLPLLDSLVQFIQLKMDALDVPDDVDIKPRRSGTDG
ncbi:hypothetical protein GALL_330280 [mine drainage metagenome]|uniref:Uncharacterized protein n=1 Tax=mine drainage metagenome TaxID=410659 RepID=A0A1J5QNK0_9ZZZZ